MANKMFMITGGSGGIGEELAYSLAEVDYTPLILYNNNYENATRISDRINAKVVQLNLLDLKAIDKFVDRLVLNKTIIEGVVLGASPTLNLSSFGHISESDMEEQWRINVLGHQRLLAGLVRKVFRIRKRGIIIGILSDAMGVNDKAGMKSMGSYIMAKYGLQGLLSVIKAEYSWMDVSYVKPGFTDTKMLNAFDERFLELLKESGSVSDPKTVANSIIDKILAFK